MQPVIGGISYSLSGTHGRRFAYASGMGSIELAQWAHTFAVKIEAKKYWEKSFERERNLFSFWKREKDWENLRKIGEMNEERWNEKQGEI